jgi:hypothetical protein
MFNAKIRRGQRWLQQEIEDGSREMLIQLAMGGVLSPRETPDSYLVVDFGRLRPLFRWASAQPETTQEKLETTILRLPPRVSAVQRYVLLQEVATISRFGTQVPAP